MRRCRTRPGLAALLAAALVSVAGCDGRSDDREATSATINSETLAHLRAIARELAVEHGDSTARGRFTVETTREVSRRLLDEPLDDAPIGRSTYLVWMEGNFGQRPDGRPLGYRVVAAVDGPTLRLLHSAVIVGELRPGLPDPESIGLAPISLAGDVRAPEPNEDLQNRLRALVQERVTGYDQELQRADVYSTNAQDAHGVFGTSSNGNPDDAVYVIAMEGRFESFVQPPGAKHAAPPSPFLTLIVGAEDLEVRSSGWTNRKLKVESLGDPIRLVS